MLPALEMDVAGGEGRQAEDSRLGTGGRPRSDRRHWHWAVPKGAVKPPG